MTMHHHRHHEVSQLIPARLALRGIGPLLTSLLHYPLESPLVERVPRRAFLGLLYCPLLALTQPLTR